MKVRIPRKELHACVQDAARACSGATTLPILKNLRLHATGTPGGDTVLEVGGTNLELALERWAKCEVLEPGVITVPAQTFAALVASLPEGGVELETSGDDEHPRLIVRAGKAKPTLACLSAEEFPVFPEVLGEGWTMSQGQLKEMLRTAIPSVQPAGGDKEYLKGVHLLLHEGKLRAAASDVHHVALHRATLGGPADGPDALPACDVIVPTPAVQELLKVLGDGGGDVELRTDGNQLLCLMPGTRLSTRLIEGKWLKIDRIFPQDAPCVFDAPVDAVLAAVRRAKILSEYAMVVFRLEKNVMGSVVRIQATGELGDLDEEVPVELTGEAWTFGVNLNYLIPFLTLCSQSVEHVRFEVTQVDRPFSVKPLGPDDRTLLVAPMTVKD